MGPRNSMVWEASVSMSSFAFCELQHTAAAQNLLYRFQMKPHNWRQIIGCIKFWIYLEYRFSTEHCEDKNFKLLFLNLQGRDLTIIYQNYSFNSLIYMEHLITITILLYFKVSYLPSLCTSTELLFNSFTLLHGRLREGKLMGKTTYVL